MYQDIRLESQDGVATVTLHRPEKLNAYTPEMGDEIVDAFARIRSDADVRAVILAGAGRAFCAGVDLERLKASRAGAEAGGSRLGEESFLRRFPLELAEFPKPVLAAVQGAAVGVGVTMILPCDLRIAADDARLALPFVKLGLLPGLASTHWLPRLVGLGHALDLVLTGRTLSAQEAFAVGLVSRVVPAASLAEQARETARTLAACRPEVLVRARRALRFGMQASAEQALENERAESAALRRRG